MALDGCFLRLLKKEIEDRAIEAKVERIFQPSREELIFHLRGREERVKLFFSARTGSSRVHFTEASFENPQTPPMLCMLLRKHLVGARLAGVRMKGLERVLWIDFDAFNELQDLVRLSIAVEIMGRHSNIILVDGEGKIIDSVKRVDLAMSTVRVVLPGVKYEEPPTQSKLDLLEAKTEDILAAVENSGERELSKALLENVQGLSPIVCRELAFLAAGDADALLGERERERLAFFLKQIREQVEKGEGQYTLVSDLSGKPFDFAFMNITQYGTGAVTKRYDTASELLDDFFSRRDEIERMRQRAHDLLNLLTKAHDRITRKLAAQRQELAEHEKGEEKRVLGDLISANIYRLEKGAFYADLENFFKEGSPVVRVPLDPMLTPAENAQRYYKQYRKSKTAVSMLTKQIEQGEQELKYIDTVFDALSRARTEGELTEIREELQESGYLRSAPGKKRAPAVLPPLKFESSDGFEIFVGRNNKQNDDLTLKRAAKGDVWLHAKDMPGAHTIIAANGRQVPERTLVEAAALAALHSKGALSGKVAVDYTLVKNVKKPKGAKPGMVIYHDFKTIVAAPEEGIAERLRAK